MEDNNLPKLTEQLSNVNQQESISPVDYVYNSIKSKATTASSNSLLKQIDSVKNDADYFSDIFSSASGPNKASFNEERINIDEAYTRLSDGTFITRYNEGFIKGADNEELYAQDQSKVSKWTNGITKFVGKTANNVVGGTLGTAYGAIAAIAEGNWEKIYDNSFYDFLDDQNTKMDNFAANYRTQEERGMGFFESMTTANFWADDFLGGMSFLTGTVISEALWASATGGTSLSTTTARIGLRGSKYFNTAKNLTKGVKQAQKIARKYNRLSAIQNATSMATKYGKAGQALNMARFTYTGAGFEAGMEARLYQKEQRENFNKDFESLNGRKPTAEEIADFENNLDKTTNTLWAANMALVGTSNFAILGKTFGVTSPFKASSKTIDKMLFGKGVKSTFGEAGERLSTEAIKRTKLQKALGFSKSVLKGPFYEGFIEEGGQSVASTAMESYLTSRYNPSKDAMGLVESMYEGLSHTYGTKEGWKEVGLGMLIGLVGGEGSNLLSGQPLFSEAREVLKDEDSDSTLKAELQEKHTGVNTLNRIFATKFEDNLKRATEVQNAQKDYDIAEKKGDAMGMATAQTRVMLSSLVSAVNMDYLNDQVSDFKTALEMQDPVDLSEHYGIELDQVESKIDEVVSEYRKVGEDYKSARDFADYIISDNPKELFEDATDINVEDARAAIAYQMVMTEVIEKNAQEVYDALVSSVSELSPKISSKYIQALTKFNQINRSKKEDVLALSKVESKLKLKKSQLNALNKRLLRFNQIKAGEDTQRTQKNSDKYNKIVNKIAEVEEEISNLTLDLNDKNSNLEGLRTEMSNLNLSTRALANQLDAIDPFVGKGLVEEVTLEETQKRLEDLDSTLKEVAKTKPQLVERIIRLGEEYRKGISMWKRNADTIEDLTNPDIGLNRVGTFIQKKKQAGTSTLELLKKLQETQLEELEFTNKITNLVNSNLKEEESIDNNYLEDANEQEKAESNLGEDILQEEVSITDSTPLDIKLSELRQALKDLVGKNRFVLDNFTDNSDNLVQDKAPTQEDIDEYNSLRESFISGDINSLIGRPVDQISSRIKERSGLTDDQISKYQELSQKLLNWRIVTGTNSEGVSIKDILNQIEAYEQQVTDDRVKISAEQVLEMSENAQTEFSVDISDPDFVNSMDRVNIKRDKIQTTISHLSLDTIKDSDFNVTYLREDNRGTESNPDIAFVYELEKEGKSFEIQYTKDHHRVIISNNNTQPFLDGMGMRTVKYNTKTGWGYVFKDGVPMKSDFGINLINNPEVNILNPQEIYKLQPGDKVSFSVNMKDMYNNNTIIPLIKGGDITAASKLMSIYVVNDNGEVLGFLKSGLKSNKSNFNKVRQEAVKQLQNKLDNPNITLEDLANDNTSSVINLPFEVEVEKTFIGTPNIELDDNGNAKTFSISKEQSDLIVGFGYSEKGKIKEDSDVRKTFIPKDKSTPYVVINHGNTKVAFPVGLSLVSTNIKEEAEKILNSEIRGPEKTTQIITLLKSNGIEPANFNIDSLSTDSENLNSVLSSIDNVTKPYSKKDIQNMSKEEFIASTEILINLDKTAFVSPKVKIGLSKKLINTATGEQSESIKLSNKDRQDLLIKHLVYLAKAENKEQVKTFVVETGDEVFVKEFLDNSKFNSDVIKSALSNKTVPVVNTEFTMESILQDVVDITSEDIPLDIKEDFSKELEDLKNGPTLSKVKSLASKVIKATENRYRLVNSSVDINNLYHISTTEKESNMFDKGYVRVIGDFYKKVNLKYTDRQLLEGLFNKYKQGNLPSHIEIQDNLSIDEFIDFMPNTLLDIYKLYYNSQPIVSPSKKSAIIGNDQYLREEFKGDFATFIKEERDKGSELYKNVLQHFHITDKGILKDDVLIRDRIDEFKEELGPNYSNLLNYSLINKHIELQETPQNIIFVEDIETTNRLQAVNNSNLPEPKSKANIIDDKTISFSKVNNDFIQHKGDVYEQVYSDNQGNYAYSRISTIDPNFIITEVVPPFDTTSINTSSEIDDTKTKVNITKERGELDC